jgi:hypothetical protein
MKTWKIILMILFFVVIIGIFYASSLERIYLSSDTRKVKSAVLKEIPIGSSFAYARKIMEEDGFKCSVKLDDSFQEMEEITVIANHHNIDYLYCYKEKFVLPACEQVWQIAVVKRNDVTGDILVSQGSSCL